MLCKFGDSLRVHVTTIVSLILFSLTAHAGSDLNIGGSLRSYPLSGVIDVDAGYGILLWGSGPGSSPWYGYLRPRLDASTAVSYNSLDAALEFYPLSFLGGRAGGEAIQNDHDYSSYDCVTYICQGRFYHTYVLAEVTLGAGPVFGQFRWRRERWSQRETTATAFIEPTAGFALAGADDSETIYRGMVGVKLGSSWSLAGVLVYSQMDSTHGISRFPFAVVRYISGPLSVGVGAGSFSSPLKREEASGVLFLNWEIKPSLALH